MRDYVDGDIDPDARPTIAPPCLCGDRAMPDEHGDCGICGKRMPMKTERRNGHRDFSMPQVPVAIVSSAGIAGEERAAAIYEDHLISLEPDVEIMEELGLL